MKNKGLLAWHSWFGLISGLFILFMGLTGSILVFNKEIDTALEKDFIQVKKSGEVSLDKALRTVQETYPDWDTRIVSFGKPEEAIIFDLRRNNNNDRQKIFVHPSTGVIIKSWNANTHFTRWLLKLHYSLHAGTVGKTIILLVGILFFLSLVTGLWLFKENIWKVITFKIKIKHKNKRAFWSSVHRVVGTWALLFNLLLVITGIVLSYAIFTATFNTPRSIATPMITISVDSSLKVLKQELPDFNPSYIRIPTSPQGPITYFGKFNNDFVLWSKYYNSVQWPTKGEAHLKVKKVAQEGISYKLASIVQPLHFGEYGGILLKVLYCLVGLSAPTLTITGFLIWYFRKKKKKKKAVSL